MEFLPQELVQAIVQEIDDISSLKSCSLTGSIFRDASQRILLHSLTLERDVQPAYTLLTESPRIASYITHLSITLERVDVDNDSLRQSLQYILAKLVNRQPLHKLKINSSDGFSRASILRLLTMAPVVSFAGVVALTDREDSGPSSPTNRTFQHASPFISIAAPTLEYLYLAGLPDRVILPAFSALHTIALDSWFYDWIPWLPDVISSVVRTSPLLDDIVVRFLPTYATSCPRIFGPALTMLDADLAAHARRPVIRWLLDFLAEDQTAHARIFEEFTTSVRTAMPKTHEQGRIILEDRRKQTGRLV
ncbi:hypothetical protein MSAN_02081300 [Mycena sanguinolenta]|uniref:F-box domain-containing protein n=1 Tax=Mycena sanguinolenta TaxID=230812 RepID=A0A8H7CKJ1_9AGAR|nr:hypothetical protein MSAN_02081300 [Mycena sanguinolenta]